jgi:hypothetical protein
MSDWTEADEATAIALYRDYGASVAARWAGTSRQTVYSWVRQAEREEIEERMKVEHPSLPADKVEVGDIIEWCDRHVQVVGVEPVLRGKPGRWLHVLIKDTTRKLHWFDNERVYLPATPLVSTSEDAD